MKKELTPEQKADLRMKYEIAEELGLLDKITRKRMEGAHVQRKRTHWRYYGKAEARTDAGGKKREKGR